ncbi:hypothetical protein [Arthrobacter sp. UYEF13]|uniref:hypothetical protein n=1 Tax=Pseudarthrobacter sp. S6 TaxID=3418420 RepID=UPI003396E2A2
MTEAGLLEAQWENPDIAESQGRPRLRLYSITNNGRSALAMASRTASVEIVALHAFKPVRV